LASTCAFCARLFARSQSATLIASRACVRKLVILSDISCWVAFSVWCAAVSKTCCAARMSASVLACARDFSSGESCGEICGASGFVGSGSGSVVAVARRGAGGRGGLVSALDICGSRYGNSGESTCGGVGGGASCGKGSCGGCVTPTPVIFGFTGCFGQPPKPIMANTGIIKKADIEENVRVIERSCVDERRHVNRANLRAIYCTMLGEL